MKVDLVRRSLFRASVLVLMSFPAAGAEAPWPMSGRDLRHTGSVELIFPTQVVERFNLSVGKYGFGAPVIGRDDDDQHDVVYGASSDFSSGESIWAVRDDGQLLWSIPLGDQPGLDATGYLDPDTTTLYLPAQDNSLLAVDVAAGQLRWRESYNIDAGAFFRSGPVPGPGGDLYLLTDTYAMGESAALVKIRPDGELVFARSLGPYSRGDGALAFFDAQLVAVTGTFVVVNDVVWPVGQVLSCDGDGEELWSFKLEWPSFFYGTPAVDADGSIYFGARRDDLDEYLLALRSDGSIKWENLEVSSHASVAIGPQWVYTVTTEHRLVAIDKANGMIAWGADVGVGFDANRAAPVVDFCGNVVVATTAGRLLALTSSGALMWERSFEGQALGQPAVGTDGTIYVKGYGLHAYAGTEWPADCGMEPDGGHHDGDGQDGGAPDGGVDAGADTGAEVDGGVDAGADTGAEVDGGVDAGADTGAEVDGGVDAGADTGAEVDGGVDAGGDAGGDTGTDTDGDTGTADAAEPDGNVDGDPRADSRGDDRDPPEENSGCGCQTTRNPIWMFWLIVYGFVWRISLPRSTP